MNNESNNTVPSTQPADAPKAPLAQGDTSAEKIWVLEHNRESLRQWFEQQGLPAFRADQILKWVYQKGVADVEKMTDLSKDLRDALRGRMEVFRSTIVKESRAADGVIKLLLEFPGDGRQGVDQETEETRRQRRGPRRPDCRPIPHTPLPQPSPNPRRSNA